LPELTSGLVIAVVWTATVAAIRTSQAAATALPTVVAQPMKPRTFAIEQMIDSHEILVLMLPGIASPLHIPSKCIAGDIR